jgi:hypothetical protein
VAESPEKTETNGKALGLRLVRNLEAILAQEGLAPGISYRLGK